MVNESKAVPPAWIALTSLFRELFNTDNASLVLALMERSTMPRDTLTRTVNVPSEAGSILNERIFTGAVD